MHLHVAIIDEADSVLIDESRSPLGISGPFKHPFNYSNFVMKLLKIYL
jgi:preprotein translocase subunit SecA